MPARKTIGQSRQSHGAGMGRHVPAVSQQRHRVEPGTGGDLHHHGDRGQPDHHPGAPLVLFVLAAQEIVGFEPGFVRVAAHDRSRSLPCDSVLM